MEIFTFTIIVFFLLGTIFGSFASVLITRIREKKGGILTGRSECPVCHHTLSGRELVPLFSYLFQRGKCHHCKTKISLLYPALELLMGIVFAFLAYILEIHMVMSMYAWFFLIFVGFIMVFTAMYDIHYMEISDIILIPAIGFVLLLLFIGYFFPEMGREIFWYFPEENVLTHGLLGAFFLYSFFYIQILLPGLGYAISKRKWHVARDVILWYFLFPFSLPFLMKDDENDEEDEIPGWIGAGDLRIALLMGLSLGFFLSVWALIFTYLFGATLGTILLLWKRKRGMRVPFGPLLLVGWCGAFLVIGNPEIVGQIFGNL